MWSSLVRAAQGAGRQLLRWTFWSPLRLGIALVCVLLLVLVVGQVNRRIGDTGSPTAAPSAPEGLPSGWETWPRVPGRPSTGSAPRSASSSAPSAAPSAATPSVSSTPAAPSGPSGVGTPAHKNTDTAAASAGAQKAATGFAQQFLNIGKGDEKKRQADWIRRLTPYVVPALVTDLKTVALDNVPTGTVQEAQVTSVSDFNATVQLATTAGQMVAVLEWSGSAWQVSDYLPPSGG